MRHGILVAFEGIDGAGKTTQARRLADLLESAGVTVVRTKEPTDGAIGMSIRQSATTGRMSPSDELEAFIQDRREHVESKIAPALVRGDVVIVDRYYYSTAAYQGARGFDASEILARNEAFAPQPDVLFVLDVPVSLGHERISARGDRANLFEDADTLHRARDVFRGLAGEHVAHLDATRSEDALALEIITRFMNGPVFERTCAKAAYKSECEPAYCTVRMAGCPWVDLNMRLAARGAYPTATLPARASLPL